MTIFYKPQQSNIASEDGKKKWHPRLVKVGKPVSTQKIAERVAKLSSLSPGDVHNVIRNLNDVIGQELLNSHSVNLEGWGTYTILANAKGKGVDTSGEVGPAQIKNLRIRFSPTYTRNVGEGVTRSVFAGIEYERYGKKLKNAYETDEEGGEDDDDDFVDPTT